MIGSSVRPEVPGEHHQLVVAAAAAARSRRRPLVPEHRERHLPAVADVTDAQLVADPHGVQEHLVERRPAGHLPDRADLDAVGVERARGTPSARRAWGRRVGPADGEAVLGRCAPSTSRPSARRAPTRRRRARLWHASPARSLPAPGSENSWQQNSSSWKNCRHHRSCCSGVPNSSIVGAISLLVTEMSSWSRGTSNSASSSLNAASWPLLSPSPPNSLGHGDRRRSRPPPCRGATPGMRAAAPAPPRRWRRGRRPPRTRPRPSAAGSRPVRRGACDSSHAGSLAELADRLGHAIPLGAARSLRFRRMLSGVQH